MLMLVTVVLARKSDARTRHVSEPMLLVNGPMRRMDGVISMASGVDQTQTSGRGLLLPPPQHCRMQLETGPSHLARLTVTENGFVLVPER